MVQAFDPRIVQVKLQVNNETITYEDIAINACGIKFANALQNECTITLTNLTRDVREYILTETSPFTLNHTPKTITLLAGRKSYGTFQVYAGNIVTSVVSQPPDISVAIKCLTGNFLKGNVLSRGQPTQISLFQISKQLAQDMGTLLTFQATNKTLSNYLYQGSTNSQLQSLNFMGGVNAFIDDNTLVIKDAFLPLNNTLTIINKDTGMIGIPELTERGVRVKFLLDNKTVLGGGIQVTSEKNPAANGLYVVYKLQFEVANRETPFYWIAEAAKQR